MAQNAKERAKAKGLPCDITFRDILIPERCPMLDIPLFRGTSVNKDNAPSVDRIDNTKGYTKDNIWVVSDKANRLKGDLTLEELETCLIRLKAKIQELANSPPIVYTQSTLHVRRCWRTVSNPSVRVLYRTARDRSHKFGRPFNLDPEDIVIPESCPLLGIPIRPGKDFAHEHSPNLDRIDNNGGYVRGNVWVISHKANRIKSNLTFAELESCLLRLKAKADMIRSTDPGPSDAEVKTSQT